MNKHVVAVVCVLGCLALGGCGGAGRGGSSGISQQVPVPVNLTLPKQVRIHPFTTIRSFDEGGQTQGLDVQIESLDSFGDSTRAFGEFRFELYTYKPNSADPKGKRVAVWTQPLLDPAVNAQHWDRIKRMYEFRLQWDQPIPEGRRYVLLTVFSSPFGPRLFDERVFMAGA